MEHQGLLWFNRLRLFIEQCPGESVRVGEEPDFPSLCERCVAALKSMDRSA